jgi:hypothetical protein
MGEGHATAMCVLHWGLLSATVAAARVSASMKSAAAAGSRRHSSWNHVVGGMFHGNETCRMRTARAHFFSAAGTLSSAVRV